MSDSYFAIGSWKPKDNYNIMIRTPNDIGEQKLLHSTVNVIKFISTCAMSHLTEREKNGNCHSHGKYQLNYTVCS